MSNNPSNCCRLLRRLVVYKYFTINFDDFYIEGMLKGLKDRVGGNKVQGFQKTTNHAHILISLLHIHIYYSAYAYTYTYMYNLEEVGLKV